MAVSLGDRSPKLADLRELRTPRGRRDAGAFAVEGKTLLDEALRAGLRPRELFLGPQATSVPQETPTGDDAFADTEIYLLSARGLARCSDLETPPGIIAVFDLPPADLTDLFAGGGAVLGIGVSDPGNAGTLVRTAEIFGIDRVAFADSGVDPYAPKVVRATMGAIFRMKPVRARGADLLAAARAAGYTVFGATRAGTALDDVVFPPRAFIAIGAERAGLEAWLPEWDVGIAIPHLGAGESLNAAIAGGIIMYARSRSGIGSP